MQNTHPEAARLRRRLDLRPHPEGGWYRQTFKSMTTVTTEKGAHRSSITSILFLLESRTFSAFHKLRSDETWHFYRGDSVALDLIDSAGNHERRILGAEDRFQTTMPAGVLFAAHVEPPGGFALVGCDVAPGFEYDDFTIPSRDELTGAFPQLRDLIERYTRLAPPEEYDGAGGIPLP